MSSPFLSRHPAAACLAGGAVAGCAGALLGIGGGLLMVPFMAVGLGLPLKRAVGTSLLAVPTIALAAVITEHLGGYGDNVRWLPAALLASGAVLGSWLGARVVARTPAPLLGRLLAALLVIAALKMIGALDVVLPASWATGLVERTVEGTGALFLGTHVATGIGAGIISSMFGVGGGILAVPLLALLHPSWAFQACRATSLAMIVPTSLAGAFFHRKLEQVDMALGRALVPGAVAGSVAGVLLANRLPGRPLELLFAGLLGFFAFRLARRREP